MSNPIIESIKSGNAPKPARLAAARGMLPLAQDDLLQILVLLLKDPEKEVRSAARETLGGTDPKIMLGIAQNRSASEDLLSFIAIWEKSTHAILEAIILNTSAPDDAIAEIARRSTDVSLLEAITINHQRLIRHPAIIDAILSNPARNPEAERRARELKTEFFEKELGAARIVEEQKARARISQILGAEISEEEFQQTLSGFESDIGVTVEDGDVIIADPEAELRRFLYEAQLEGIELHEEQKTLLRQILSASIKEKIFLGLRGNREARQMLSRDPNKLVVTSVLKNPRITDGEVEAISKVKWMHDEALRLICMNRAWITNYSIMHNLVQNPRTPMTYSMDFIKRLQLRDLKALVKNRGVPDVLRNMAGRLTAQRQQ